MIHTSRDEWITFQTLLFLSMKKYFLVSLILPKHNVKKDTLNKFAKCRRCLPCSRSSQIIPRDIILYFERFFFKYIDFLLYCMQWSMLKKKTTYRFCFLQLLKSWETLCLQLKQISEGIFFWKLDKSVHVWFMENI